MTQAEALAILKTGANVFLTGEPGSGKTHTVNQYIRWLRERGIEPSITASTGIAATHIGGFTIHSWSGIGIRRTLSKYDLDAISQNRRVAKRVENARILIIDEVSMLSAKTFSMVDAICRELRQKKHEPFGGLQVVLVGDFFQLPPINKREENEDEQQSLTQTNDQAQFAFLSLAWNALKPLTCYLLEQHRQEDAAFLEFLSAVRRGSVREPHKKLLRTRYARAPKDGITQLYSHNEDVDRVNDIELIKLPGDTEIFQTESRGPEKLVAALKRGCLSPEVLSLKIGARVMFTKNDVTTHKFVNGTQGLITGFERETGYPIVQTARRTLVAEPMEWSLEDSGRVLARITQIPLRLAWALTVHKSQGMSLDAAHMDLSETFEYGQGYVALSRVRTLEGLSLAGLNSRALEVHPEIILKDDNFREQSLRTREAFGKIPASEIDKMHCSFIRACGGLPAPSLRQAGRQADKSGTGRVVSSRKTGSTYDATKELVSRKLSLDDMAKERNMTVGTIVSHLEKLAAEKKIDPSHDLAHIKRDPTRFEEMRKAFEIVYKKEQEMLLSPARELLGESYSYNELRLARLFVTFRRRRTASSDDEE